MTSTTTLDEPRPVRAYPGHPSVSVICPCYNEVRFIQACIASVIEGEYPLDKLEILVVDGGSTDGTRAVLDKLVKQYPVVRIIDNPRRLKPIALNLGIAVARGSVLMRVDGHAIYPPNYVRRLVEYLLTYDVVNVGGVRRNVSRSNTLRARVLARLLTHPFGVGDAKHYTGLETPRYSDIVFLFCCRRELFDEVGGFKEPLIRGQDREFNLRVVSSGRKMLLVPDVHSTYFARDTLKGFFSWAVDAGATPFRIRRHATVNTVSIRNLIPPAFLLALVGSLGLSIVWPTGGLLLLGLILVSYFAVAILAGLKIARAEKDGRFALLMPIAFLAWHLSYGAGAILGMMEPIWTRETGTS